ncbi:phosphate regulon sensor histidine kinase PhoR [Azoarcus sp. KH32C]|uniref:phosphate regulon sensor histidine kinase PhoR n=1 Tax=Azoarcus sp. KH32C TaxID=748247 RepID=UPI0002386217|nr:phosphate regulon sensor histidine kinase PhoR [Azoarcus sp. KH32C]BAL22471.1 sensory transduction histidine kinase [Azoarcus sp. KH32C]
MIGLLALVAIAMALADDEVTGLVVFSGGLLILFGYHLRKLERLAQWTLEPVGAPLPSAMGIWRRAFRELERRSREAHEARERLTSALDRFHDASHAMPDGVLYLSGSDRIEWLNRKAEQHFGLHAMRDQGLQVTTIVREPEFVRFLQAGDYRDALVLNSSRHPGLTLLVQVVPFGEGQKMVVSRDVSQLEKLETMRRDFIANVSHELRTPLTVVSGFLETLIDGFDDFEREDVQHFLQLALDQSLRMQALIGDLLTLSALETGAPAPAEERVPVAVLLHSIAHDARVLSNGRHEIAVDLGDEDECGILLGSEKELRSAFANLANNAVRYTPDGGRICLSWRRGPGGGEFSVQDNGIGIDPVHIPRLTERFYRVDRGRSRETGGTGLGLAIVKHILSRHHAELRIESEPGKGSRFSAVFPASRVRAGIRSARS